MVYYYKHEDGRTAALSLHIDGVDGDKNATLYEGEKEIGLVNFYEEKARLKKEGYRYLIPDIDYEYQHLGV